MMVGLKDGSHRVKDKRGTNQRYISCFHYCNRNANPWHETKQSSHPIVLPGQAEDMLRTIGVE